MKTALGLIGLSLVVAAAVGFNHYRGMQGHSPVADWDYADPVNTHPIKHAGPPVPMPSHLIVAKGDIASTPNGIHIRLVGISKGNTMNPDHYWAPSGGPIDRDVLPQMQNFGPDQEPRKDGPYRELLFSITSDRWPTDASTLGFIPGAALQGLSEAEKVFHGWDPDQSIHVDRYPTIKRTGLYVDVLSADKYVFGLACGDWKTVDSAKNELIGPPNLGDIAAKGNWGKAVVTHTTSDVFMSGPIAIGGQASTISAGKSRGFPSITLTIEPASGTCDDEFRFLAFDTKGNPVPIYSVRNTANISLAQAKEIASFEVQSRPYQFLEFEGVHFNPLDSAWKGIVWGPRQTTQSIKIGDISADLTALVWTKPGDKDWNNQQYVTDTVYTPDGHVWKDHPESLNNVGESKMGIQMGPQPPKELPRPWVAEIKFHFPEGTDQQPLGRIKVFGSDSPTPGQGLHEDLSLRPRFENLPGQLFPLRPDAYVSISLAPQATYAQLLIEVAKGEWAKVFEVKPDPEDVKPMGPDFRVYTLEVGPEIHVHYRAPGNNWVDKRIGEAKFDWRQTRVFARMRSGQRVPMALSSYQRGSGKEDLNPCYDLDRDATETEGDMIALRDVEAFEIESRPIAKGIMVVKLPKVGK